MKKVISIMASIVLIALCVVALCGCSPAGEYKLESLKMSVGGVTVEYAVGEKILGVAVKEDSVTLTLNADGTYEFKSGISAAYVSEKGTWTKKGSTITFDDSFTATVKGKTLTVDYSEEGTGSIVYVMKRA